MTAQSNNPSPDLRPLPADGSVYRKAAVLLLMYPRGDMDYIVFTRRTDNVEHHKGQISLPGGSQDPEDADMTATALREAHEELGLDPALVEVVAVMDDVYVPVSGFVITPVVSRLRLEAIEREVIFSPSPDEVAELIEVPLDALRDEELHRTELRTVNGVTHNIHYYTYGPYVIWGATGRIIYEFLLGNYEF